MSDALDLDDARKCADTFEGTPVGDTLCSLIWEVERLRALLTAPPSDDERGIAIRGDTDE